MGVLTDSELRIKAIELASSVTNSKTLGVETLLSTADAFYKYLKDGTIKSKEEPASK